jgi:galactokinase
MNQIENLKRTFSKLYGDIKDTKVTVFFSPGRVNLIGEHTDYNGGYVFPCALSFGTYLLVRLTDDDAIKLASTNFDYTAEISINNIKKPNHHEWINYPLGVADQFIKKGIKLQGMELLFSGDIPHGAGLSSSASIEVLTGVAFNEIFTAGFSGIDIAKIGKEAENYFVGVNCGIMDQFAVAMGAKEKAIFLNCDTLEYELVPAEFKNYKLVIANTNKKRGLADSKYNERRSECETAVRLISKKKPIKYLAELSPVVFETLKSSINNEVLIRRALHVVTEIDRVLNAVKSLKSGDLEEFGTLMNESHNSLRDDYEVTGIELDTLVEEARKIKGTIGSRMTGAGFGGCTISLVEKKSVDEFCSTVGKNYFQKIGIKADFYIAEVGNGASKVSEYKM